MRPTVKKVWRGPSARKRNRSISKAQSLVSLVLVVMDGFFCPSRLPAEEPRKLEAMYRDLSARFDPNHPGRGTTDYPGNTEADVPKAYAMILRAELLRLSKQSGKLSALGAAAAHFLLEHSDERKDGFPGWGVPIAWDAFADDSINPAHTKYAISTAIVIDTLLDWIEAVPSAPRARVLALARESIRPYLADGVLTPMGMLPYSLEPADRRYETFNTAAYLAGVIQRYSRLEPDPELRSRMRAVADKTVAVHLAHRRIATSGGWYWQYMLPNPQPNDLAHAIYVIHGLSLYAANEGTLRHELDLAAMERHIADFVDPALGRVMLFPGFWKDLRRLGRLYGLGMGLSILCRQNDKTLREAFLGSLDAYRTEEGSYLTYPPDSGIGKLVVREYEAYALMGLASCLAPRPR